MSSEEWTPTHVRLSRPCYDKFHRCPGWVGGGLMSAKVVTCDNGRIRPDYDDPWWMWKPWGCDTCEVVVLPYHARWLDPSWLRYSLRRRIRR